MNPESNAAFDPETFAWGIKFVAALMFCPERHVQREACRLAARKTSLPELCVKYTVLAMISGGGWKQCSVASKRTTT